MEPDSHDAKPILKLWAAGVELPKSSVHAPSLTYRLMKEDRLIAELRLLVEPRGFAPDSSLASHLLESFAQDFARAMGYHFDGIRQTYRDPS